jgi:hypothetical protein
LKLFREFDTVRSQFDREMVVRGEGKGEGSEVLLVTHVILKVIKIAFQQTFLCIKATAVRDNWSCRLTGMTVEPNGSMTGW